jgi:hypothetical protein
LTKATKRQGWFRYGSGVTKSDAIFPDKTGLLDDVNEHYFPIAFAGLWLAITTTLGIFSGWFLLMWKYPDRKEETALLQLKRQSGSMGLGVAMQRILSISVCPSGLRVGIMRIFGLFCRDLVILRWADLLFERISRTVSRERPWRNGLSQDHSRGRPTSRSS